MEEALLKGRIQPGMFPTEVFLSFQDTSGEPMMVIVPDVWVVERDSKQYVRVRLLESNNGASVIYVPGEVVQGQAMVSVASSELVTA
jgi:hypothetical protein